MALLSDKFKLKPQLSGADIKSLYEVEPNAFTDTDKTKLIGIEAEAQITWIITSVKTSNYIAANNERIPCDTSGGPFTITLPNSGRVSVFDIAGTTPVTGFGVNSLTINPDSGQTVMGDNTLEVDIGASSVELYLVGTDWRIVDGITSADNASLDVVPGSLLTDGSVSSNKLDASVNVSLGLADTALQPDQTETVSGDYTFNGALYLPNNSRINNIEHFYQITKPTSRGDGSELAIGDRWWKTDDGTEWFWNGTYWVSTQQYVWQGFYGNYTITNPLNTSTPTANSSVLTIYPPVPVQQGVSGVLFEAISFFYRCSSGTFSGFIDVYAGSSLVKTIDYNDFSLNRDRHRCLVYAVDHTVFYTDAPLATDAGSINYYLMLRDIVVPLNLNRGATQCLFRKVLI